MPVDPPERSVDRLAVDLTIRIGLLVLFVGVAAALLHPFLSVLLWSVILTVALYPVFAWLRERLGGRGVPAAVIVTFLSLALIFGPIGILSASLVESLLRFAEAMQDRPLDPSSLPQGLVGLPVIGPLLDRDWTLATGHTGDFLKRYGHTILVPSERLLKLVAGLAGSTLVLAMGVFLSGFLFVPAPRMVSAIHDIAVRIVGPRGTAFVALAGATIRNVARGVIGIAVLQALIVGCVLLIAGVPHAGLLTTAVLILAILQIGSSVVILPLILWIWLARDFVDALIFSVAMLPVAAAEHFLKPIVLAKGLTTPMLVIALGVLGGVIAFGLTGLFVGPIVLAVFYEMLVLWVWPDGGGKIPPEDGLPK